MSTQQASAAPAVRRMPAADIQRFFATLQAANPQPASELAYTSVFELLAAVLLSAQATDVSVNKATRRLFLVANTPQALIDLGEAAVARHIQTIGLFRNKAKHLLQTCRILVAEHAGQVPRSRAALEALPGVGRKTANVVLNVAFGEAHQCGRHACVPRQQPQRPGAGQDATGGGTAARCARAAGLPARRPPLADPAWPLCLHRPIAQVR